MKCAYSCACGLDSSDPGSGDGGIVVSLPCWGIVSESPTVRVWGKMVVVGLLCDVQVCSLAKMMTRAEDGSRQGFVSRFTRRVRWVLLLSRAAVESELRWHLRGDDDRLRVVCRVLGWCKTSIIPL
jgi:hypothetical protein